MLLASPVWGQSYRPTTAEKDYVWEYPLNGFTEVDYDAGVESLISHWESVSGKTLKPGSNGRVGIKVFTQSGPGLMTPLALTKAVIDSLEKRGYSRSMLFIIDGSEQRLRECGYLPSRKGLGDETFNDVPVYSLDTTSGITNDLWFYDSNLPSRERMARAISAGRGFSFEEDPNDRKSYLASTLFLDTDFWINLPMASDNEALGISGALANATLWNVTNNQRFFLSPANAPVATAEMAAIPELNDKWVFTILSLERYQFLGGPRFNALYTGREQKLWLSANPVALDYLMWRKLIKGRRAANFDVPNGEPPLFEYASKLGLGPYRLNELKLRKLGPMN
ncbi:DUF362 domain-containing protein [Cerasicoccus arenae]|uniref:DUF362 domain-containing protein n=1 Tax=Cerasicoccus arenae TaxID=424488 RepID=A0A8J3DEZ6_9BACT|nr:DUF362 domain-containing protein [Cerasicoccus arenae]MBK1857081.1 DUF362 domain-containing protein [Cerasicoccus arenae]GHB92256.1 hypothetical protein GCM10007047_04150 [Cerasicoccus arenae]